MAVLLTLLILIAPVAQLVIYDDSIALVGVDISAFEFRVAPGNQLTRGADWPYTFRVGEYVQGAAGAGAPIGLTGHIQIAKGRLLGPVSEVYVADIHGNEIPVVVMDLRRRYPGNERR